MGRFTAFLSSVSRTTAWTTVVWVQSFQSTASRARTLLRYQNILQKKTKPGIVKNAQQKEGRQWRKATKTTEL